MRKKLWLVALGVLTLCILLGSTSLAEPAQYSITENVIGNGSVTALPEQAAEGDAVTLTVTPESGWALVQLTAKSGTDTVAVADNRFTMPAGDVTVSATFKKIAEVSDWAGLKDKLIGNDKAGGAVRLAGNITAPESNEELNVPDTAAAWLDLNGHTLNISAIASEAAIHILGTMTLADQSTSQQGKLVGGNANDGFVLVDGGILNLTGGIITGVSNYYGTVFIMETGSFNMSGGTITGNANLDEESTTVCVMDGSFCMSGGSITNNTGASIGGVGIFQSEGSFDMSGGSITGNKGVYIGGCYVRSGIFNMTGGTIAGNTGNSICGGVGVESGAFNMSGGSIKENSGKGGGVYIYNGTVDISGGSITGNIGAYGGVYAYDGQLCLSGTPVIAGNRSSVSESAPLCNIKLAENRIITVTGPLFDGARIGVSAEKTLAAGESLTVTSGLTAEGGDAAADAFSADTGYLRLNEDGEAELYVNPTPFSAWQRLCERAKTNGTIRLDEDCIAAADDEVLEIPAGTEVVLDLNGNTLDASAINNGLAILVYGTLTIEDGSADGTGRVVGGVKDSCVIGVDEGTLNLTGGNITGSSGQNGTLSINQGVFNMSGGSITGNMGTEVGGIYADQSTFNMSGGSITGNTGRVAGCAFLNSCTFTMTGGSISGNTGEYIGGLYLDYCTVPDITGGSITGNKGNFVGGIYLIDCSLNMTGGIISGNTGDQLAGGVYTEESEFNMLGGAITGNTGNNAGGMYVSSGEFNMLGGTITSNTGKTAGGLYLGECEASLAGGAITGNAGKDFGGAYLSVDGTLSISGNPRITDNTFGTDATVAIRNLHLPEGNLINISDALSGSARIGVSMEVPGAFTGALSGNAAVANFMSDDPGHCVRVNDEDSLELFVPSEDEKFSVSIGVNGPGTVTASVDGRTSDWAVMGSAVTVNATPTGDAVLASIAVKDADNNDVPLTDTWFTMPDKAVTVTATFKTYTDVSSWTVLKTALYSGGGIRLTAPVTATAEDSPLEVPSGVNATLDLNGFTLNAEAITDSRILVIQGDLTLVDESPDKSGRFENGNSHADVIQVVGGAFHLNGGTITGGEATYGAVHLVGGTFDMNGGAITGLKGAAGSVFVERASTFNMSGGIISGNEFPASGGVMTLGSFNMSGGKITGNAGSSSGGVLVYEGNFTISGNPEITGNTCKGSVISNVSLLPGSIITVSGPLDQDARIGVRMNTPDVFTTGLPGKGTAANFTSDDPNSRVKVDDAGEAMLAQAVYRSITVSSAGDEGPDVAVLVNGQVASEPFQAAEGDIVTLKLSGFPEYMQPNLTLTTDGGTETPILSKNGEYSFEMPDENVTVTAVVSIPEDLVIRSGDIPDGQFQNIATIKTVTIGPGVTSIGANAFKNCTQLEIVTIKDLESEDGIAIGKEAFVGCSNLSQVNIGKGVVQIGVNAFIDCASLVKLGIGEDVESIGDYAFFSCSGLTDISFGNSLKKIGQYAFAGCPALTTIEIPDGVTEIRVSAFKNCTGLTSAILGSGLTSVGRDLFTGCSSLKVVWYHGTQAQWDALQVDALPAGTVVRCFTDVYDAPAFSLPGAMETIRANAFAGAGMREAYIQDGCMAIGAGAFANSAIERIRIPSSVTSLDKTALDGCYIVIYGRAGSKAKTYYRTHSDTCLFVEEK